VPIFEDFVLIVVKSHSRHPPGVFDSGVDLGCACSTPGWTSLHRWRPVKTPSATGLSTQVPSQYFLPPTEDDLIRDFPGVLTSSFQLFSAGHPVSIPPNSFLRALGLLVPWKNFLRTVLFFEPPSSGIPPCDEDASFSIARDFDPHDSPTACVRFWSRA